MRILTVTVVPECARTDIVDLTGDAYKVYVTQSSKKGKANKAMLKMLAQFLKVRETSLIVSKGDRSNTKTVILTDD